MSSFDILRKYNIRPKKRLGQNFLVAQPTLEKIVRHLSPTQDDKVLEIGPGPGIMTTILTEYAKFVAAVETDKDMVAILEQEYGEVANLHIVHGDILDTNLDKLLGKGDKWLFAGNIPYNITSPLLFHLRKYRNCFRYGILTMQQEVAERIVASPRSKEYGILSVAMQSVANVDKCFNISPTSFVPEPRVESAVIKISFENAPEHKISDEEFFMKVVRAAFSTRRKKLKNALTQSHFLDIPSDKIEEAIAASSISKDSRAEELDIKTFVRLAEKLLPCCGRNV